MVDGVDGVDEGESLSMTDAIVSQSSEVFFGGRGAWPSLGVELEMPTAHIRTGRTHPVGPFFRHLGEIMARRGVSTRLLQAGGVDHGLQSSRGLHSLDNGYNNLESSLGPVPGSAESLDALALMISEELRDVAEALELEEAMVINFSEHPCVHVDEAFYRAVRAPKSIYDYQVLHRGWNHMSGFDAKAHNSPCTAIPLEQAVEAMNCLLALAPVFIALYANSPLEAGRLTENKENRLTIWPRQLDCSRMPGDRKLHRSPTRPFRNLADYLTWMFGPGTQMWFAALAGQGKNPQELYLVQGDPPLLDFLRGSSRLAVPWGGGPEVPVTPELSHLAYHQFTQYSDCRLRYGLNGDGPDLETFLAVLDERPHDLERLIEPHLAYCYLEGRAAGANYPDRELMDAAGEETAASVAVSPSALQYGLLRNLDRTKRLVARYAWSDLLGLRRQTIIHALKGEYGGIRADRLCAQALEIAGEELDSRQAWMAAYPEHVLQTGKTGADRALERLEQLPGGMEDRIRQLVLERGLIPVRPSSHLG